MARYGDGDFAVMRGQRDRYQKWEPKLAYELGCSLSFPHPDVLNALIPPPGVGELANQRWHCYMEANAGIIGLLPTDRDYGNAAISRMDSNIQLLTAEWWLQCSKLWADKRVTLVRGSERSLTMAKLMESPGAPEYVEEVTGPAQNAWDAYEDLFVRATRAGNEIILLCTGLVSRPLVHSLVEAKHIAYDLGHLGIWFDKGQPKVDARA